MQAFLSKIIILPYNVIFRCDHECRCQDRYLLDIFQGFFYKIVISCEKTLILFSFKKQVFSLIFSHKVQKVKQDFVHASCRHYCKICRKFYLFPAFDSPKAKIVMKAWEIKISRKENLGFFHFFFWFYIAIFYNLLHTPVDANDFSHAYHYEIVNEVKKSLLKHGN